jgi:hypothetical protein
MAISLGATKLLVWCMATAGRSVMGKISTAICAILLASHSAGCGCSDTGLEGDTSSDSDVTDTDASTEDAAWDPGEEGFGEPGWRDSTEPWCEDRAGYLWAYDVWSDRRGVYVLVAMDVDTSGSFTNSVYFNDGTGWSLPFDEVPPTFCQLSWITGIPDGKLFGYGHPGLVVEFRDDSYVYEDFSLWDMFVVNEALVYGALIGDPRLVKLDDSGWGPFPGEPLPYQVNHVWANEESIFCAGESGIILSEDSTGDWIVHDTGTMASITAIWGLASDDVWAGTHDGQLLHYDGETWKGMEWPDMGDDTPCRESSESILGMWGTDSTLFFHTQYQLVRWDGASFTSLAYWPGEYIAGMCIDALGIAAIWGNSETELFLAVNDYEGSTRDCEHEVFLLWWDGSEFHWF